MDSQIWTEKYRPSTFEEIKGQKEIVKRIKALVESKNVPHMLFSGPAGVGKTTTSLIIAKQLHKKNWKQNFLELNASVTGDTPIMIKEGGKIKRTNFEYLANKCLDKENKKRIKGIKILSIRKDKKVKFLNIKEIMRHTTDKIRKIKYEGGELKTSLNHSLIVINQQGELESKRALELKKGDLLVTFKTDYSENLEEIDISKYKSQEYLRLSSGMRKNPTLRRNFDTFKLDKETSWLLGLYMAEGCVGRCKTSNYLIYTLAYPQEKRVADIVQKLYRDNFEINSTTEISGSGFNRERLSSIQVKIFNSQISRFYDNSFYGNSTIKRAPFKRVPNFIFETNKENKLAFFEGYFGDGHGKLNDFVRYSSRSKEGLIDVAWLGRLCNLYTSTFKEETRAIWDKKENHSYLQTKYIPSELMTSFLDSLKTKIKFNYKYDLRHALYSKKSMRLTKKVTLDILSKINENKLDRKEKKTLENIKLLLNSDLTLVKIRSIKEESYHNYVYDVSVPGAEMFWGGTTPILLHNSDSRGIDTIRNQVKDFAKTMAIEADCPKIILLDEADALTKEAQQALRRTMETYANSCRFILSCNVLSKIIDPIKSRCAMFKFKQLDKNDIEEVIENIVEKEDLNIDKETIHILYNQCSGDVRQLQNILQSCSATSKKIDKNTIGEFLTSIESKDIEETIKLALSKKFIDARKKLLDTMLNHGLSGLDLVKQIQREVMNLQIDDNKKLSIIEKCGEIEFRLVEGSDDFIQLEALLAFIAKNS